MKYYVFGIIILIISVFVSVVLHLKGLRQILRRPAFQKYEIFGMKVKKLLAYTGIAILILSGLSILTLWTIQKFGDDNQRNFTEVKNQNRLIYDSLLSVSAAIRKGVVNDSFSYSINKALKSIDSLNGNQTDTIKSFLLNVLGKEKKEWAINTRRRSWIIFLVLFFSSLWLFWKYKKTKKPKYLIYSAITSLLSFGYESIVKFSPKVGFDINIEKATCICDSSKIVSFTKEISVGPFNDGFDSIPNSLLKNGIDSIQKEFSDKKIITIYITGGVDKRPLRGESKKKYGDNFMLAQSRANAIKRALSETSQFNLSNVDFRVNVSAANNFKDSISKSELAQDRVVRVSATYLSGSDW
ncbi:MAG: hypothetical protein JNK27_02170 [Chitinophagaceae bacterium]|nr:hypothetical protein [Chitinophagaceae bacterium]